MVIIFILLVFTAGQFYRCEVTEAHDYDVLGTLLPGSEPAPVLAPSPLIQIGV